MNERFHLCIFDFKKKKTLILLSGQKKHHTRVLCAANKNLTQISMNLHVVQLKKKKDVWNMFTAPFQSKSKTTESRPSLPTLSSLPSSIIEDHHKSNSTFYVSVED